MDETERGYQSAQEAEHKRHKSRLAALHKSKKAKRMQTTEITLDKEIKLDHYAKRET